MFRNRPTADSTPRPVCTSGLIVFCSALFAAHLPALDWQAEKGSRWAPLAVPGTGRTGFTRIPVEASGLLFTNYLDELTGAANRVLYNGSGVAVGDIDHDGLPEVFLCNLSGQNALFKNLGNWRFTNITATAGLGTVLPATRGAVFADINGDGYLDLLLTVTGRGVLSALGDGKGKFGEPAPFPGVTGNLGSTTLAVADVDGNGTLDVYVTNYRPDDIRDRGRVNIRVINGRPVMAGGEPNRFVLLNGKLEECGQPDQLLLNNGNGSFQPVSWTNGAFLDESGKALTEPPRDWGLTAAFHDVNGDLSPDLYVCNDYWTPDRFWLNDGKGHFRAIPTTAVRKTSASSMSTDFSDINRDGFVDFFVVDMLSRYPQYRKRQSYAQMLKPSPVGAIFERPQVMRNTLFLNRQDGTFAEISYYANLPASDWSWAPFFTDVDLDGYEDLLIGAGHFRDVQDYDAEQQVRARQHSWQGFPNEAERQKAFTGELMEHLRLYPLLQMPIGGFRNNGDCTFSEVTAQWGLNQAGIHQGLVAADFDGDGDQDLIVNNLNGQASLYRNESGAGRIAVRLSGEGPNHYGIGGQVSLIGGAVPKQTAEITCGGHYQSGAPAQVVFATGSKSEDMSIEVTWRNGRHSLVPDVKANRIYDIQQTETEPAVEGAFRRNVPTPAGGGDASPNRPQEAAPSKPGPWFEDVSEYLAHTHPEVEFNDYERQPLLPFKLSQLGPGVAWFDLNGDGRDELIVGAGKGGPPAVFQPNGKRLASLPVASDMVANDDLTGLVGWVEPSGIRSILAGVSGYEVQGTDVTTTFRVENGKVMHGKSLALGMSGGGALAMGDLNGPVMFVAGGVMPGRYPLARASKLSRYDGKQWTADARNSVILQNLGIVNGAVWSDLDGDGLPELVLACEWGPIRVFKDRGGALFEVTKELGLQPLTGWWRGVTTGDLNNDGRQDIIASNWGLNSFYRASEEKPLVLGYGELSQPGIMDIVETEYVEGQLCPSRQFGDLVHQLPFLHERFGTQKAYSEATLDQALGDRKVLLRSVQVTTLASTAFINTGSGFQPLPLPAEAQFAPAFSVNVADFDGDGNEDVFLSQNFFGVRPEITRIDAGVGLLFQGDGTGKLTAVPCVRSGFRIYGEQRGAAVCDYDEDGRVDLVVAQNGAETKLFHNKAASPGLRVRLKGPPANPSGIGAVMRLQFRDRQGPAREIHAGSGYWSMDSVIQVLATPTAPAGLWVRWPGGRVTTTVIPPGAGEITVDAEGKVLSNPERGVGE